MTLSKIPSLAKIESMLPAKLRNTLFIRTFGLFKVPMILFVSPSVEELDDEKCVIRIPLNRRTQNHLKSMYFGTLCVGADCAGGLIAMNVIRATAPEVSLVFKDFKAEFLKRPEGDVHFTCTEGREIKALVEKAHASGERESMTVKVIATVPSQSSDEPVAKFELTLSLKRKRRKNS